MSSVGVLAQEDSSAKAVAEEYSTALADLTVNNKPLINMLTMLAEDYLQHAPTIVKVIESHLLSAPDPTKMPILYLVDSIVKNVKKSYVQLFTQNLVSTFCTVYNKADEATRSNMLKLRQTWGDVFPAKKLYALDTRVRKKFAYWPHSVSPSNIHINPKFIKPHASSTLPIINDPNAIREELLKKQKELIELQKRKVELELLHTKAYLDIQQRKYDQKSNSSANSPLPSDAPHAFKESVPFQEIQPQLSPEPHLLPASQETKETPLKSPSFSNANLIEKPSTASFNYSSRDPRVSKTRVEFFSNKIDQLTKELSDLSGTPGSPCQSKVPTPPSDCVSDDSDETLNIVKRRKVSSSPQKDVTAKNSPSHSKVSSSSKPSPTPSDPSFQQTPPALPVVNESSTDSKKAKKCVNVKDTSAGLKTYSKRKSEEPIVEVGSTDSSCDSKANRKGKKARKVTPEKPSSTSSPLSVRNKSLTPDSSTRSRHKTPTSSSKEASPSQGKSPRIKQHSSDIEPDRALKKLLPLDNESKSRMIRKLFGDEDVDLRSKVKSPFTSPGIGQEGITVQKDVQSEVKCPLQNTSTIVEETCPFVDKKKVKKKSPPKKSGSRTSNERKSKRCASRSKLTSDESKKKINQRKLSEANKEGPNEVSPDCSLLQGSAPVLKDNTEIQIDKLEPVPVKSADAQACKEVCEEKTNKLFGNEDVDLRQVPQFGYSETKENYLLSSSAAKKTLCLSQFENTKSRLSPPSEKLISHHEQMLTMELSTSMEHDTGINKENIGFSEVPGDLVEEGSYVDTIDIEETQLPDYSPPSPLSVQSPSPPTIDLTVVPSPTLSLFVPSPPPIPPILSVCQPSIYKEKSYDTVSVIPHVTGNHFTPKNQTLGLQGDQKGFGLNVYEVADKQDTWTSNEDVPISRPPGSLDTSWSTLMTVPPPMIIPPLVPSVQQIRTDLPPPPIWTRPPSVSFSRGLPPQQINPIFTQQRVPNIHPPSLVCSFRRPLFLPPLDPNLLEFVEPFQTLVIGEVKKNVRFYGETAIIMNAQDDPRELTFQNGVRNVIIDDTIVWTLDFNSPYVEKWLYGMKFHVRLGAPTRELYINGIYYEGTFGGPSFKGVIGGAIRTIQLEGPKPNAKVGQTKRTDLVAGEVGLIVDGNNFFTIFLDGTLQKFEMNGFPCVLRFCDSLRLVLLNEKPFKMRFNDHITVILHGERHFLIFLPLPSVQPGGVQVANMDCRPFFPYTHRFSNKPSKHGNMYDSALPARNEINLSLVGDANPIGMNCQEAMPHPSAPLSLAEPSCSNSNFDVMDPLGPGQGSAEIQPEKYLGNEGQTYNEVPEERVPEKNVAAELTGVGEAMKYLSFLMSSSSNSSTAKQIYDVERNEGSKIHQDSLVSSSSVNVEELFKKLVALGIVPPVENPPNERGIKPVSFSQPATLKTRQTTLISLLYSGVQCSSCGVRYPTEDTVKYRQHLDWHFRQNRRERDSSRSTTSRKWYYDVPDWINFKEIEDADERAVSWFELQEGLLNSPVDPDLDSKEATVAARYVSDGRPTCFICKDTFEHRYCEDKEEWVLKPAMLVDEQVCHPTCYEDYQKDSYDEPRLVVNEVCETIILDDTNNEVDSTVDLSEPKTTNEGDKLLGEESSDDDVLHVEVVEPKIESIVIFDEDEEETEKPEETSEEIQEVSSVHESDAETSNSLDYLNVTIKKEKLEGVDPSLDPSYKPVTTTIDGDMEFEGTTQPTISKKIKITIKSHISKKDSSRGEAQSEAPVCDSTSALTFSFNEVLEPASVKPKIHEVDLRIIPLKNRGNELSGLCSIM